MARSRRKARGDCLAVLGILLLVGFVSQLFGHGGTSAPAVTVVATTAAPPSAPAAARATTASATPAAPQTVTYIVTGSPADVTYGPVGSNLTGSVPMRATAATTPDSSAYSVMAILQGAGGTVSCEVDVSGKVVARDTASGAYFAADCEISQDPVSGQWLDDNLDDSGSTSGGGGSVNLPHVHVCAGKHIRVCS